MKVTPRALVGQLGARLFFKMSLPLNKQIKAIFFDIDGTIFHHDDQALSPHIFQSVKTLIASGYKVGLCTSRTVAELKNVPQEFLDLMDVIITGGGTIILYQTGEPVYVAFDPAAIKLAVDYLEAQQIPYRWCDTAGVGYYGSVLDAEVLYYADYLYQLVPASKIPQNELITSLIYFTKDKHHQQTVLDFLPEAAAVVEDFVVEVTPQQMNKLAGIKQVIKHWNIQLNEVLAFGDGANDVKMLQAVGYGVAMENGKAAAREVADYVTGNVLEDGVSLALAKFDFI